MKKLNIDKQKVNKIIKVVRILSFTIMILLVYIVSPRITQVIKDIARYLCEVNSVEITRVVELILSIGFIVAAFIGKNDKNK